MRAAINYQKQLKCFLSDQSKTHAEKTQIMFFNWLDYPTKKLNGTKQQLCSILLGYKERKCDSYN